MSEPPSERPELTEAEHEQLVARLDEITRKLRASIEEGRREREAFRASLAKFRTDLTEHLRANSRRILRELLLKYFPDYSEEEIDEAFALADAQQGQPLVPGIEASLMQAKPAKRASKAAKKTKPRSGRRP